MNSVFRWNFGDSALNFGNFGDTALNFGNFGDSALNFATEIRAIGKQCTVTEIRVKQLHEWGLANFIDVACELGYLKLHVKKFSHALRDFRNYIHPYEQMSSGVRPDKHAAEICLQVLKAAVATLSGER